MASVSFLWNAAAADSIRIVIVEGDRAINNIRLNRAREPVVKVETDAGAPVSAALVQFQAPLEGPGGSFWGKANATVMTDAQGLAAARGFQPNRSVGQFQIQVTASYYGQTASAAIIQVNAEPSTVSGTLRRMTLRFANYFKKN